MTETKDSSNAIVRPPIVLALGLLAGLAANWLYPMPWVPAGWPGTWIAVALFIAAFFLAGWAIVSFRRAGTQVETVKPTTAIVANGPYRFTRNPIYLGMFLLFVAAAIGDDNLWMFAALVPFYLIIRNGVVAREEAYLERKFGSGYLDYKSRVRRWI